MNGASFCHVNMSSALSHSILEITWGNQKWKGAAPIFREIAAMTSKLKWRVWDWGWKEEVQMAEKISATEARAWGKKYLIEASVALKLILWRIRGIRLIKLISRPSQQINQELDEAAVSEPRI